MQLAEGLFHVKLLEAAHYDGALGGWDGRAYAKNVPRHVLTLLFHVKQLLCKGRFVQLGCF